MTGEGTRAPSVVLPLMVAALVCDVAVADPSSKKVTLIGIFDNVNVARFPTQRAMSVYVKLTDAEGYYEVSVKYVRVGDAQLLAEARGEVDAVDRLESYHLIVPFPPLPIPEAGRYEFQVWANEIYLGSAALVAKPLQQAMPPERGA